MPLVELPSVSITGTGLFTPPESVSNAELVASLTEAVLKWNAEHAEEIASGETAERAVPDEEFIVKASGIERRYVMEKSGVLDPARMRPRLETRSEDQLGIQAEMSMPAIHEALAQAGRIAAGRRRGDRRLLEPAAGLPGGGDRDPGRARRRRLGLRHERRLLVGHVLDPGRGRRPSQRVGVVCRGRQSRDHLRPQQLRDARLPLHLRRRVHGAGAGTHGGRHGPGAVGGARHQAGHQVLEQHPQRLRVPQLVRGHRTRSTGTRLPPERSDGVPRGLSHGGRAHHRPPRTARPRR